MCDDQFPLSAKIWKMKLYEEQQKCWYSKFDRNFAEMEMWKKLHFCGDGNFLEYFDILWFFLKIILNVIVFCVM